MKFLEKSSEKEMVAEWLKAELWSARFSRQIKKILRYYKQSQKLINQPDFKNKRENWLRKKILFTYRKDMLTGFPQKILWQKVTLNFKDLQRIKIGKTDHSVKEINEAARHVAKHGWFPKLILIAEKPGAPAVVLEGHLRLTAYLMEPEGLPNNLIAIIGYAPAFKGWNLYQ